MFAGNPVPVTWTTDPFFSPVFGVPEAEAAANAADGNAITSADAAIGSPMSMLFFTAGSFQSMAGGFEARYCCGPNGVAFISKLLTSLRRPYENLPNVKLFRIGFAVMDGDRSANFVPETPVTPPTVLGRR